MALPRCDTWPHVVKTPIRLSVYPSVSAHRLLATPAVIFNRKDGLQDQFLAQYFDMLAPQYPRHHVPAVDAFESALTSGMGWGMIPDLLLAMRSNPLPLVEVLPGSAVDVPLYWHHLLREAASAQRPTQAVKAVAKVLQT